MYTACFTGHRKLNGQYEGASWDKLSSHMAEVVIPRLLKEYRITNYISGMALGVDMLAAEWVLYHKNRFSPPLHLKAAVPYKNQSSIWSESAQNRYNSILKKADVVHTLYGIHHANWKLDQRNRYMVDESRYVIAIWDGSLHGGTYNCYKYAVKKKKATIVINPYTLSWTITDFLIPI